MKITPYSCKHAIDYFHCIALFYVETCVGKNCTTKTACRVRCSPSPLSPCCLALNITKEKHHLDSHSRQAITAQPSEIAGSDQRLAYHQHRIPAHFLSTFITFWKRFDIILRCVRQGGNEIIIIIIIIMVIYYSWELFRAFALRDCLLSVQRLRSLPVVALSTARWQRCSHFRRQDVPLESAAPPLNDPS